MSGLTKSTVLKCIDSIIKCIFKALEEKPKKKSTFTRIRKTNKKSTFYRYITKVDEDILLSSQEITTDTALDGIY
jgi:hypothetical protein